jgi:hypothetical protein
VRSIPRTWKLLDPSRPGSAMRRAQHLAHAERPDRGRPPLGEACAVGLRTYYAPRRRVNPRKSGQRPITRSATQARFVKQPTGWSGRAP